MQIHPMHLHQFDQIVIAKDGYPLDQPYAVDTLNVGPGRALHGAGPRRQDRHLGLALPHPHHVERETGMFGMVTAVVVE